MEIELYTKKRGDCPIREYLSILSIKEQSIILKFIDKLAFRNFQELLRAAIVKKISGNLYELIPGRHRIFFSIYNTIYLLLSAFPKKSNKTPPKEINKALSYKEDYEVRYNIK